MSLPPRFARPAAILTFLALAIAVFYSSTAASSFHLFSRGSLARSASLTNPFIKSDARKANIATADDLFLGEGASRFSAIEQFLALAAMPQSPAGPETVTLYAADCTTPKTTFELGDIVCAKATGIPLGAFRRLTWHNPDRYVERATPILADGQTDLWTNPATTTGLIEDITVQNRGTWRVNILNARGSVIASAFYTVTDPAQATSDLAISVSAIGDDSPPSTSLVQFLVDVKNAGPNDATNVRFVDSNFVNMTLNGATQTGGTENAFTCTDSGTVDCSIANLPNGASAQFTLTFTAGAAGSTIDNSVSVSSDTTELNAGDNTSSAQPLLINSGAAPAQCVLECPNNITVTAPAGETQAQVNFSSPNHFGTCGTITTSHSSGSFFPVGSTVVTASSSVGDGSCSFTITVLDSAPPTIACPSNQTVAAAGGECSATVDPGTPTATGNNVSVTGTRNDGQALDAPYPGGVTTITWTAVDDDGRRASCAQTITVSTDDTTPPTITAPPDLTLTTGASEESSCGVIVGESSITADADDNCSVSVSRTGVPAGNFFPLGTTTITYTATDPAGNTATDTQTITVSDNTPPVVHVNGDNPLTPDFNEAPDVTVECGGTLVDPGATAEDSCIGPVDVTTNTIDTHTPGTYTLVYSATDGTNTGTGTRTVHVVDTTAPVISLNGSNPMTVECHSSFTDPGATAEDGCAGSFAATASGSVNANVPGSYTITYSASDPSGNAATPVTRTVNVVDTLAPVITLNGANPMTVECHTSYSEPGATANDACNGPVPVTVSGSVNVNVPGSYTITYSATDGSHPASATRTVNVVDTTAPVISCPANITVTLPLNTSATSMAVSYPAVTATDSCSSSVTVTTSKASGSVFSVGTTVVNATATDPAGNSSSCSFTVTVLYNFTGFFQPVDNLPTLNQVNAGRAIPVKFSLSGNKGLAIFAPNSPSSGVIPCGANDPVVDIEETVTAGSSSLGYTASSDQYSYIWKTESSWAGTCRQLLIQLNDGTTHRANFKFK
jgi:hypothetical protein